MKTTVNRFATAALAVAAVFSLGCEKQINFFKARDHLNKGVRAFSSSDYALAAERFEEALKLDPELHDAKTYGAYAYMMQYIPGGTSPENTAMADKAIAGFKEVLASKPDDKLATTLLASLYFNMKDFEKAEEWHRKRIAILEKEAAASPEKTIDPVAAESYYTIGVIKWTDSYTPRMAARAEMGMKPDDPGPLKDDEVRKELAATTIPKIDEGITALNKALEINPDYADAMAYLNLLNRERADFADSQEEYEQYQAKADEWVQKTLATKKRLAEAGTVDTFAEGQ
ncbi:MAG: tetratricopeptide repeat protein [Bryobacterales bacterium]|nr:tetratricopeptide repeat protein [Bryobacterales bacterium]